MKKYYCNFHKKILNICRFEYNYFLNKLNVVGLGLGNKVCRGIDTNRKCIKVFVRKKVTKNHLNFSDVIPKKYKNIETDVIETGIPKFNKFDTRIRPALGGYSIGSMVGSKVGTLGCLVTDGTYRYILSNSHILSQIGLLKKGAVIIQPGKLDGGEEKDKIATLSEYIHLYPSTSSHITPNYVDCGIARIVNSCSVSNKIAAIGSVNGIKSVVLGQNVRKSGRTTELTFGKIYSIGVTFVMEYKDKNFVFANQICSTKISELGDSGSIAVDKDNYAVGLVFASSNTNSFINPIGVVLKTLGVDIVTS